MHLRGKSYARLGPHVSHSMVQVVWCPQHERNPPPPDASVPSLPPPPAAHLLLDQSAAAGDLDKIRLVKITGFVRSTDGFAGQSQVLNGASDLFLEAFGREKGEHARSAVGVNALPLGVCVEIEAIAEVGP